MVSHAFTCWVLDYFLSHVMIFARGERTNAAIEGCSEKIHKIIQKTVGIEYFLSKLAVLQPEKKILIRWDSALHEIFQNSLSVENFVATDSFSYTA